MIRTNPTIPEVTKNLIIINALFFLAKKVAEWKFNFDLDALLGAFYPYSQYFRPWQIITHMFMHANMIHLAFNMFALWMFGSAVESLIGSKKFLILYFVAGLGSYLLYNGVHFIEAQQIIKALHLSANDIVAIKKLKLLEVYTSTEDIQKLSALYTVPMVGASGAIYGVLVAFGVLYPNAELMLMIPPIPIKAKYFIPILIILEIVQHILNMPQDNVAHLAHLGGALFGYFYIRQWKKKNFYFNI